MAALAAIGGDGKRNGRGYTLCDCSGYVFELLAGLEESSA